ncbi:MAG TPA: heat-inducible transcriptional repressor HrcA [Vicinamibacterales bacterium]|jgi:heat-inducible transcriptional repressor|nr:heat-inducible transcriptional repressor HrcA [Vicinamibacterales bacterium]
MQTNLSTRSARILAALVGEYIHTAEPVGSARLAQSAGLNVSSATVRNTLAELEDLGYLQQPHTSAGRIPTDRGYRFYVDQLLETPRPLRGGGSAVEAQLRRYAGSPALVEDVLVSVSGVLSRASRLVAFALPMSDGYGILKEIEFVRLSASKVLVVVVTDVGQVTRKAIDVGEEVKPQELRQAANYLNTEFAGLPLERVRAAVVERLQQERTLYSALRSRALRLVRSSLEEFPRRPSLFVDGASSLLDERTEASGISMATLRALLRMVEEKARLVRILNEYIDGPGLTIVIGHEHRSPDLRSFSLVAATYDDGTRRGTVGVIGPMRMHYSRTIAVVDGVAQAVSRVLRDSM